MPAQIDTLHHNAKDLSGRRFGKLVAVKSTDRRDDRCLVWECKCDCGNTTFVKSGNLTSGVTKSCGSACINRINIEGQRFGKLVAVEIVTKKYGRKFLWKCKCDCGKIVYNESYHLRQGIVKSCGCGRVRALGGRTFGWLTAIEQMLKEIVCKTRTKRHTVWRCMCRCGNTTYVTPHELESGGVKSCGCLAEARNFVHGAFDPLFVPMEVLDANRLRIKIEKELKKTG